MAKKEGIPPWVWIGCGCLLFPLLIALVLGGAGFFAFNYGKNAIEKMADPEQRAAAAREVLGAEALPPGWHVRTYFAFPFGFSMVVLGDGTPLPPPEGETFEEKAKSLESLDLSHLGDNRRVFIYLELDDSNDETIEEVLNGSKRGGGMNLNLGIKFRSDSELSRGDLTVAGERVAFVGKAGQLDTRGGDFDIVYSEMAFDCKKEGDKKRRLGLLFELQEPAAGAPTVEAPAVEAPAVEAPAVEVPATGAPEAEAVGSVADSRILQGFLDHFEVCRP